MVRICNERTKICIQAGACRSRLSNKQSLKYLQWIFWWRILNLLSTNNTIINIDKAWYNRSVKQYYSWLPTGRSERIINDRWQGRVVIIFALIPSGDWIALICNKTTNSTLFIRFLFILKKFTEICLELVEDPIMVTLDNASMHLTDNTKRAAEILKMKFSFYLLTPLRWLLWSGYLAWARRFYLQR